MAQTLNISQDTMQRVSDIAVGMRVDRPAAVIAAGTNIFTVAGGSVMITGLYGEIMVAIDAANVLTLTYDATAPAVDTVLGSASEDINTFIAGRMLYLPIVGGALTVTAQAGACPIDIGPDYILPPGHFDLTSTGTTTTGTIRWSLWYVAIDSGAYVYAT